LVKDNIATDDNMQTTAGSLAIYGNHVPADAPLIQNLRAGGAIILGKANLGEWANFRDDEAETYPLAVGWSARGGSTNNAYDLSYTSWVPAPAPAQAQRQTCAQWRSARKRTAQSPDHRRLKAFSV